MRAFSTTYPPARPFRCAPSKRALPHALHTYIHTAQPRISGDVQPTVAALQLESNELSVVIRKPTAQGTGETMSMSLFANGGIRSEAAYRLSMCRNCRHDAADGTLVTSTRSWDRIDEQSVSLDGLHMHWQVAPSTDAVIDLDATAARFSFAKQYAFSISLGCTNKSKLSCVADGDTVETTVQLGGPLSSTVTVKATIKALASCAGSTAALITPAGDVLPATAGVHFVVSVVDADGLPIKCSTPTVRAVLGNSSKRLYKMAPGDNLLGWDVPSDVFSAPGSYTYHVVLEEGWDEAQGRQTQCVIHNGTLVVVDLPQGFNTSWVLVGSLAGAVVLVGVLFLGMRRWKSELKASSESGCDGGWVGQWAPACR